MIKNKKAFTLIELIVVVAIIGILVAVLVPSISGQFDNAKETAAKANAKTFYSASQTSVTTILAGWEVKGPVTQGDFAIPSIYYESGEYRVYFGKNTADSSGEVEPISNAVRTGYVSANETDTATSATDLQTIKEINKHMRLYLGDNSKLTTDNGGYKFVVGAEDTANPADVTMKIKTTGKNATGTFAGREYFLEVTGFTKDAKYEVKIGGVTKGIFKATGATQKVDLKGLFTPVVIGQTTTHKADVSVVALNPATGVSAEKGSVIHDLTFYEGDGSTANPYLICDPESLEMLSDKVNNDNANFANKNYKQIVSIDMSPVANFVPIAKNTDRFFSGSYDGGAKADGSGYQITNLKIEVKGEMSALFGAIMGADLKNIRIGSGSIMKGESYVAGVVGYSRGNNNIRNCYNAATIIGNTDTAIGGVIGSFNSAGTISQCYNTGSVTANKSSGTGQRGVGGITGYMDSGSKLEQCYNTGDVTSVRATGGIVGYIGGRATVTESYNTGAIKGMEDIGGVVGLVSTFSGDVATIAQVYNTGSVTGSGNSQSGLGGVIGRISDIAGVKVTNSYNTGEVRSDGDSVGGVIGSADNAPTTTLTNCFNTGNVTGATKVGGSIGAYNKGGTLTNVLFKNTVVVKGTADASATAFNVPYTNISSFLNATGADRSKWDDSGKLKNPDGTLMAGPNSGGA